MRPIFKVALSLLLTVVVFSVFVFFAFSGLFEFIETRFYNQRIKNEIISDVLKAEEELIEYHKHNKEVFGAVLTSEHIQRTFLPNQSRENIFQRETTFNNLHADFPDLLYVRIIDPQGKIHYSTYDEDIKRKEEYSITYNRLEEVGTSIPQDDLLLEEDQKDDFILDAEGNRIIYQFPFYDHLGLFKGTALFYMSIKDLKSFLIKKNVIEEGRSFSLVDGLGYVFNIEVSKYGEIAEELKRVWQDKEKFRSVKNEPIIGTETNNEYFLFSKYHDQAGYIGYIVPEKFFTLNQYLKNILMVSFFLSVFLILFLLFSIKQDKVLVLSERIKRFQINFLREYVENRETIDWEKWKREMGRKKKIVSSEIKQGLGKLAKDREEEVDQLIEKSWDEILSIIGEKVEQPKETPVKISNKVEIENLEEALERILRRGNITIPVSPTTQSGPTAESTPAAQSTPPPGPSSAEEIPAAAEEPEAVEELEEVGEAEAAEEPEAVEELEEVGEAETAEEPEAVEELEEVGEAETAEAETAEEPEAVEELEEVGEAEAAEEPEAVEELEEVGEAETVEGLEEVEEMQPEQESGAPTEVQPAELAEGTEERGEGEEAEEAEEVQELPEESPEEVPEPEPEIPEEAEQLEEITEEQPEEIAEPEPEPSEEEEEVGVPEEDQEQYEEEKVPEAEPEPGEEEAEDVEELPEREERLEGAEEEVEEVEEIGEEVPYATLEAIEELPEEKPEEAVPVEEREGAAPGEEIEELEEVDEEEFEASLEDVDVHVIQTVPAAGEAGAEAGEKTSPGAEKEEQLDELESFEEAAEDEELEEVEPLEMASGGYDNYSIFSHFTSSSGYGKVNWQAGYNTKEEVGSLEELSKAESTRQEVPPKENARTETSADKKPAEEEPVEEIPEAEEPMEEASAEGESRGKDVGKETAESNFESLITTLKKNNKIEICDRSDLAAEFNPAEEVIYSDEDGVPVIKDEAFSTSGEAKNEGLQALAVDVSKSGTENREPQLSIDDLLDNEESDLALTVPYGEEEGGEEQKEASEGEEEQRETGESEGCFTKNGFNFDRYLLSFPQSGMGLMKALLLISRETKAIFAGLLTFSEKGTLRLDESVGFDEESSNAFTIGPGEEFYKSFIENKKCVLLKMPFSVFKPLAGKVSEMDQKYLMAGLFLPVSYRRNSAYLFLGLKNSETSIRSLSKLLFDLFNDRY